MIKNRYFVLIFLFVLLLLVRLPIVYTSIYKIYDPQELYTGTIAKELIEGPIFPLFDYQAQHFKGGTLVSGILAVPLFLLFGQSYFSLKLLAVTFSLATLLLWYLFLLKFFNKRVAILASLFFILSPPIYTKFTLMSFGKHCESNLFSIMAVFIFYQIFFKEEFSREASDKKLYYALFGLVSGLGLYFDYIFFITLMTCFLFWFIFDKRFILKKTFLVFFIFFMIGFSPWVYYNATHNFKGVCINDIEPEPAPPILKTLTAQTPAESLHKLVTLTTRNLPNSLCFENFKNIRGRDISYLYYLIFSLSFLLLLWLNVKSIFTALLKSISLRQPSSLARYISKESFLLAYPIIFLLLYSLGPYHVKAIDHELYNFFGYKKLIVLYPFIFVILALFLNKLWGWKNKNSAFLVFYSLLTLFLISSGLIANYALITPANFSNPCIYEGYSYYPLGTMIGKRLEGNISKAIVLANKVGEQYRPLLYQGIGVYQWQMFYRKRPLSGCMASMEEIAPQYRPYAFVGLGLLLGSECRSDILQVENSIKYIDEKYRPYVYNGLGRWVGLIYGHRSELFVKEISKIAEEYQPDCYRGAGVMVGAKFGQNFAYCVGLAEKIEPRYQCYYFEGLAMHQGWRYKYYLKKDPSGLIKQIPERCRSSFANGLREAE